MKSTFLDSRHLAVDPSAAAELRSQLRADPQGGLKQTARQFEGLLLQQLLKSMRDATPADGLMDSEQSRFFTAIGDQQLAQHLAAQAPIGLATLIEKQLARQSAATGVADSSRLTDTRDRSWPQPFGAQAARTSGMSSARTAPADSGNGVATKRTEVSATRPREFVDRVWSHALEASATTGIPAQFLVAHSALESGWGKREIRTADGSPSFNLFGVKAGRSWSGPSVEVSTTEFVNGVGQSTRARFRVYSSYAEAFRDYADLLRSKSRFADVIGQKDGVLFARSLQRAGYATDPMYADKLARIIGSTTLRQALAA